MDDGIFGAIGRWLRRFGHPVDTGSPDADLAAIDERLSSLEQTQREIAARLRILELQGTPRGNPRAN